MEKDDVDDSMEVDETCEHCGKTAMGTCVACKRGAFCSEACRKAVHADSCSAFASGSPVQRITARMGLSEADTYARLLLNEGVVVVPVYDTPDLRAERHRLFDRALETFPEYRRDRRGMRVKYVKSQFGALGNPSSFHNTFVRLVRKEAMWSAVPVFSAVRRLEKNFFTTDPRRDETRFLEQIVDRMRIHLPGEAPSKESWHRDTTPTEFVTAGDSIFGGWINLDVDNDQFFSCIKHSHLNEPLDDMNPIDYSKRDPVTGSGFKKYSANEQKQFEALNLKTSVRIPPGHMVIFYQEIVHEVMSKKRPPGAPPSYRLFTGWRLTHDRRPFLPTHPDNYYTDMATPRIKSGQAPALYSVVGNWAGTGTPGLVKWSKDTFKPELLIQQEMASTGEVHTIAPRAFAVDPNDNKVPHMVNWSLRTIATKLGMQWPLADYPAYTDDEKRILMPADQWTIDGVVLKL